VLASRAMHKPSFAASLALALSSIVVPGCGGHTTDGEPSLPATDAGVDAPAPVPQTLTITEVSFNQAVKVPVFVDGLRAESTVPVIVGRPAFVRVGTKPAKGWTRKNVKATLTLKNAAGVAVTFDAKKSVGPNTSTEADLSSTFNFDVPGEAIDGSTTLAISLVPEAGGEALARVPEGDVFEPLLAKSSGPQLKIVVVPVRYGADGSNRVPDTSADALAAYANTIYSMYPTAKVEISAHEPFDWKDPTDADGSGWDALLEAMVELRAADKAPNDVYYYGLFKPNDSFWKYCKMGCVLGLSGQLTNPNDATGRASIGVGYSDDQSANTMAHEIGHAHGRGHAPCGGPRGVDKKFPYSDGSIGVYGFDLESKDLHDPGYYDVMGYCEPRWISAYTYKALYDRISFVNAAKSEVGVVTSPKAYRIVRVDPKGKLVWGKKLVLDTPPAGEPYELELTTDTGTTKVTAQLYRYGDLPGGMLILPEPTVPVRAVGVSGIVGVSRLTLGH